MKKLCTVLLALILSAAFALSSAAATVSVANELNHLKEYYSDKTVLTVSEESLSFAAMNMLSGRITVYRPPLDGSAQSLATNVLISLAAKDPAENRASMTADLVALQGEDGSFGELTGHCLSMLALTGAAVTYRSGKAYASLVSRQNEDGSFGESAQETALAISALSLSENESEQTALTAAVKYLARYEAPDEHALCWQIIGIVDAGYDANSTENRDLLEKLLSYQNNSDYSFSRTYDTVAAEDEATALAMTALDAVNRDASLYQRLAEDGEISLYSVEDYRPLIIFGCVLLVISVGFWCFIFAHKKNTKTLEETKSY